MEKIDQLREFGPIWNALEGGLWHTTHPDRFFGILRTGKIEFEPDIPDKHRWSTSGGPKYYPFVRSLGGVSLFDFGEVRDKVDLAKAQRLGLGEFVPYRDVWDVAVWIEVDREKVADSVIGCSELVALWGTDRRYGKLMFDIEAAHIGDLPLTSCMRVLFVRHGAADQIFEFELTDFDVAGYAEVYKKWKAGIRTYDQSRRDAYGP